MSLKPLPIEPVPEMTALIARAAFRKGNLYMRLRDELGTLYTDEDFAPLFPSRGQPGLCAWRLALVTVMQFLENLSDRRKRACTCRQQTRCVPALTGSRLLDWS